MTKKNRFEELCEAGRVGNHPLRHLSETDSTNRVAMEQGQKGAETGLVIVADNQTKGRGRLNKKWLSSLGDGLYFSMLLRPKLPLDELAKITLAAGEAVAEALQPLVRGMVMLKWPNDIIIGDRKCGGILTESDMSNLNSPLVVLGIGLNLKEPENGYPDEIAQRAGALAEYSCGTLDLGVLLEELIVHIDHVLTELEQQGWPAIRKRWLKRDITMSRRMTWVTAKGEVIHGISQGIDEGGLLYIRDDSGVRHQVLSGDVQLQMK